jgi:hypothetical protein
METQRDLLEHLPRPKEVAKAQGGAIAKPMPKLGIPRVDEEFHLHVVEQVQLEPLVPVKVETTTPHNCSRFVHMINLDHAVEIPEPFVTTRGFQTSA